MALTKNDIVEKISLIGFNKKKSVDIVETLLMTITHPLAQGHDALFSGFGTFGFKQKHARRGRNPATGDDLILRPRRVVTFKCSGKLRDAINGSEM